MNIDPLASVWSLLRALGDAFKRATPLANAVTILTPLFVLVSGARVYVQRRLSSATNRIRTLEDIQKTLLQRNDALYKRLEECEKKHDDLSKGQPEYLLATADKEWTDCNYEPANRPIKDLAPARWGTDFQAADAARRLGCGTRGW